MKSIARADIVAGLIGTGHEASGEPFYACRVKDESGAIVPAKYGPTSGRGGLYTMGADEKYNGSYELLTGDNNAIKWVDQQVRRHPHVR